jgi:hypothetical protein
MLDTELGWLAGIIDGEGCVAIRQKSRREMQNTYTLRLTVNMTHEPTIKAIKQLTQTGTCEPRTLGVGNRRDTYKFVANGFPVVYILRQVASILVTKKRHAEVALRFWDIYPHHQKRSTISESILKEIEELAKESEFLNLRGRDDTSSKPELLVLHPGELRDGT